MTIPFFLTRQTANLMEDFARELGSDGALYLLYGESGTGKTRLLQELCHSRFAERKIHWLDLGSGDAADGTRLDYSHGIEDLFSRAEHGDLIIADHFEEALKKTRHQLFLSWSTDGIDKQLDMIIASSDEGFNELRQLSQQYQVRIQSVQLMPFSSDEVEAFLCFCLFPDQPGGKPRIPGPVRKQLAATQGNIGKLIEVIERDGKQVRPPAAVESESIRQGSRIIAAVMVLFVLAVGVGWYFFGAEESYFSEQLVRGEGAASGPEPTPNGLAQPPVATRSEAADAAAPPPGEAPAATQPAEPAGDAATRSLAADDYAAMPQDLRPDAEMDAPLEPGLPTEADAPPDNGSPSLTAAARSPGDAEASAAAGADSTTAAELVAAAEAVATDAVEDVSSDAAEGVTSAVDEAAVTETAEIIASDADEAGAPADAGFTAGSAAAAEQPAAGSAPDPEAAIDESDDGGQIEALVSAETAAAQPAAGSAPDPEAAIDESDDGGQIEALVSAETAAAQPQSNWDRFARDLKSSMQWIRQRDTGVGTIQILLLSFDSFDADVYYQYVASLARKEVDTGQLRVFKTLTGNKEVYSVFFGEYDSRRAAFREIEQLPQALRETSPIPRSVGGIWQEIRRLDAKN